MARKTHEEEEVLRDLRKKKDCKVSGNHIFILSGKGKNKPRTNDLGNGSWGKIDFLVNHKGYFRSFVDELPKN
jgi:hypothetical protein